MEALNTKVELEKEGGGRKGAEDEEAYPIIIGLKQPTSSSINNVTVSSKAMLW